MAAVEDNESSSKIKIFTKILQHELQAIYVARGLDPSLAGKVAEQLMNHDALGAHARDELLHCNSSRRLAGFSGSGRRGDAATPDAVLFIAERKSVR